MINLALDKARLTDMTYTLLTLTLYQFKDKVKVKVLGRDRTKPLVICL